jgi:hypothetical protein
MNHKSYTIVSIGGVLIGVVSGIASDNFNVFLAVGGFSAFLFILLLGIADEIRQIRKKLN